MHNKLHGIEIAECHIGISMPHGGSGDEFVNVKVSKCGTGIEYRDPQNLAASLGLPPETPAKVILKALRILKAHSKAAPDQRLALMKRSGIGPFLQDSANAVTVGSALYAMAVSDRAGEIIKALKLAVEKITS